MFQIEKIFFPTDLSEATSKLSTTVLTFTKIFGAELHVVTVLSEPISSEILAHDLLEVTDFEKYQKELRDTFEKSLEKFVLNEFEEVDKKYWHVLTGDPSSEILNYSKENSIDLIIMGTVTKKGLSGWLFGSTANKVITGSECPVMTINPFKTQE